MPARPKQNILAKESGPVAGKRMRSLTATLILSLAAFPVPGLSAEEDGVGVSAEIAVDAAGQAAGEMLAAISSARASLDGFLDLAEQPEPGMSSFKLKVLVRRGDALEYFWVMPFSRLAVESSGAGVASDVRESDAEHGGRIVAFEGRLANTPQALSDLGLGELIRFARDDIVDWGYVRQGQQYGSFTVCAQFKYLPARAVDYFRRHHGFTC